MAGPVSYRTYRRLTLIGLAIACAASAWVYWSQFSNYHFAVVQEGVLYRDGNRSVRQFLNGVRKANIKTDVSLIDAQELSDPKKPQFTEELRLIPRAGYTYVALPITLGSWPTTADIQKFLSVVDDKANQPVMVHCAQGVRRTGMMVAAYQMSVLGWDKQKTTDAILKFNHSEKTVQDVRKFIEIYDPKTRTITKEMSRGEE